MTTPATAHRFGEVIEAAVERVMAQCHRLYDAPPLGSFIRAGEIDAVFCVVSGVATASLDPTRRIMARGADVESELEIYQEHPHLERLLRTDVTLTVIGHGEGVALHHYLPPLPPRIHTFVYGCAPDEVRRFTERLDFLALLAADRSSTADDVLAAAIRQASSAYDQPAAFLWRAGRTVAQYLGADTARLTAILRRLPL